jgi:hypothetical protein
VARLRGNKTRHERSGLLVTQIALRTVSLKKGCALRSAESVRPSLRAFVPI